MKKRTAKLIETMADAIELALISDESGQLNSISVWDIRNGTQLMQYRGK